MRQSPLMLGIALLWPAAQLSAAAVVVEERAKIVMPGSPNQLIRDVALAGDSMLIATRLNTDDGAGSWSEQFVYLFQRGAGGQWLLASTLLQTGKIPNQSAPAASLAMQGDVAAVNMGRLHIFERTVAGWTPVADLPGSAGLDTEIDAGTILVSGGYCAWDAYRRNIAGQWERTSGVATDLSGCGPHYYGEDVDISGTTVAVSNPVAVPQGSGYRGAVNIYEGLASSPSPAAWLRNPSSTDPYFSVPLAIENGTALVGGSELTGVYVFDRVAAGAWNQGAMLQLPDTYTLGWTSMLQLTNRVALAGYSLDPLRGDAAGSVSVFQRDATGAYKPVARLLASDAAEGQQLGVRAEISGRTVASAAVKDAVYVFELPEPLTAPPLIQDDFQAGNASRWTPTAGSQFSVVPSGFSRVYRQSSVAGSAAAVLSATDWSNQSIQADIKPTAFPTADRWFGLVVRYVDPQNYYYITLRSSNVVQIKRMVNGVFQTLGSAPLNVVLGRTYRVRLEMVGTWLRGYVDGKLLVQAQDRSLSHGQAGLMMYQTRADYDNIVVSPNPSLKLYADSFQGGFAGPWVAHGVSAWNVTYNYNWVYGQTSLAGFAGASIGVDTDHQIVQARAMPISFASGTEERWFGVMARYCNDDNYYYLAVRNNNSISLRRRVNGAVQVLDAAPLTVNAGVGYTLRLEAIGTSLRGHVNGRLLVEATDSALADGRYGLVTYKTAAQYDDVLAVQP